MAFAVLVTSARRQTVASFSAAISRQNTLLRSAFSTMSSTSDDSPYYTVAITGASGMLGTAVIDELNKKKDGLYGKPIRVVKLQRGESTQEGLAASEDDNDSADLEREDENRRFGRNQSARNLTRGNLNEKRITADDYMH